MIPADLLDQLREKDPELYENIAKRFAWAELQYDELYPEYVGDKPHLPDEIEIDNHMEHLIQGCLQERIRTRGWHLYQIRNDDLPGLPCFADIIILGHGKEHDIHNEGEGSTESEALLRAYLAAIQEAT